QDRGRVRVIIAVQRCQIQHHRSRGDIAADVSTHPVGNDRQVATHIARVVVLGTYSANIGAGRAIQLKGPRNDFSSPTVSPMRTEVPGSTAMVPVSWSPCTKVPFVEPKSSRNQRLPCGKRRACRPDA